MYPVVDIPENAPEDVESLGSKYKFWYGGGQYLFKEARDSAGEDWAEKISGEIARILGLPHADYDLGLWKRSGTGVRGVISRNFCGRTENLVLGNELLAQVDRGYAPGVSRFRVTTHTVDRVLRTIEDLNLGCPLGWIPAVPNMHAAELFVGYLFLDALVGNTDRHHENWGVVRTATGNLHLAPTFDHASSLGCHEIDDNRSKRINSRDSNFTVAAFAARERSALYLNEESTRPLLVRDAFLIAARRFPAAGKHWLEVLMSISDNELGILVDEVPSPPITRVSGEFAKRMLLANKGALLAAANDL